MDGGTETLRVGIVQMSSVDDWGENVRTALAAIDNLSAGTAMDLVCLPENALYFKVEDRDAYEAVTLDDPRLQPLRDRSAAGGFCIHIGSIPLREAGRTFAASALIRPDGTASAEYRKIHLFDSNVEGHASVRESDIFAGGERPVLFHVKGWKFGSSICYDLRFAELYLAYARVGADAILVPSAFLEPTGRAHWEILVRARAIESQAYALAAAQGGEHRGRRGGTRRTWGGSIAVDPWGSVIEACAPGLQGTHAFVVELRRETLKKTRAQIPMSAHRKL